MRGVVAVGDALRREFDLVSKHSLSADTGKANEIDSGAVRSRRRNTSHFCFDARTLRDQQVLGLFCLLLGVRRIRLGFGPQCWRVEERRVQRYKHQSDGNDCCGRGMMPPAGERSEAHLQVNNCVDHQCHRGCGEQFSRYVVSQEKRATGEHGGCDDEQEQNVPELDAGPGEA